MRWFRVVLIPLLMVAFVSAVHAPVASAATASTTKAAKTPDEMANEALAKWKTALKLTDEQSPQFESIMKDSYQKMADAKKASGGDKAKMKTSMQTIMSDRDAALAKVLTPDQMKTYQAKMKEMSGKAKEHWNRTEGKTDEKKESTGK